MVHPDCVYTGEEAMAAIGVASETALRKLGIHAVGGLPRPKGEPSFYFGADIITAIYRERGEEPPNFTCVVRAADKQPPLEPAAKTGPIHPKQAYTVNEIADLLERHRDHVYTLIHSGALEAVNVAAPGTTRARYRITEDAFEAFLNAHSTRPAPKTRRRKPYKCKFF